MSQPSRKTQILTISEAHRSFEGVIKRDAYKPVYKWLPRDWKPGDPVKKQYGIGLEIVHQTSVINQNPQYWLIMRSNGEFRYVLPDQYVQATYNDLTYYTDPLSTKSMRKRD